MPLLKDVWIEIWSLLDFETLQKTCTRVCKTWFEDIRDSGRLSGELRLNWESRNLKENEIITFLNNWKKLKVLYLDKNVNMNFKINHQYLRRVVIPCTIIEHKKFIGNIPTNVSEICFDPYQGPYNKREGNISQLCTKAALINYSVKKRNLMPGSGNRLY